MENVKDINDEPNIKNRILGMAEQHPYVLLAAVIILVIIIIMMYFNFGGLGTKSGMKKERMKKGTSTDGDGELDELIDSIHSKQKKPKK